MIRQSSVVGSLLGAAVGDALGLPYEGVSARRGRRMWGEPDRYRLLPGRGMVSDDTEHACLVAAALVEAGNDVERFQRSLAAGLRRWLLSAPAGIGLATLRATAKLCLGVPPSRSGVFSAGNGPAMRAAIVGAAVADPDLMRRLIRASTRITHTDPKAEHGALAVALAARMASEASEADGPLVSGWAYVERLREALADGLWEWPRNVAWMEALAARLYNIRNGRDNPQPCRLPYLAVLPRNLAYAAIVLTHGFRRLLPPY